MSVSHDHYATRQLAPGTDNFKNITCYPYKYEELTVNTLTEVHSTLEIHSRLTGVKSRLTGVKSRLTGMHSRLTGVTGVLFFAITLLVPSALAGRSHSCY